MAARTEFEPLSWEEAEQNLRQGGALLTGWERSRAPADEPAAGSERPWEALLDRCERMRSEVKRGKEYLQQVRRDLAEVRGRLEEWPLYERSCGRNPLGHYMQSLAVNERIEQFLPGWLERRERKLEAAMKELDAYSRKHGLKATIRAPLTPGHRPEPVRLRATAG